MPPPSRPAASRQASSSSAVSPVIEPALAAGRSALRAIRLRLPAGRRRAARFVMRGRAPLGQPGGARKGARGALGVAEPRRPAGLWSAVRRTEHDRQRPGAPSLARSSSMAARTSAAPAASAGVKIAISASTSPESASAWITAPNSAGPGCRQHVDRVAGGGVRRQTAGEAAAKRARQLGQLEAVRLAGVGAQDRRAAGVGDDRDPPPGGQRLRAEQRTEVEQLGQRVRSDDAGLLEQAPRPRIRTPPPRRPCATRPHGRPPGAPGAQRDDRFAPREPARNAHEVARVAERLQVEQHHVRRLVLLPVLEDVVRRDVGPVADRDEGRQAEPEIAPPARSAPARRRRSVTAAPRGPAARRVARRSRPRVSAFPSRRGSWARPGASPRPGRSQAARPGGQRPRTRSRRTRQSGQAARGRRGARSRGRRRARPAADTATTASSGASGSSCH